MTQEERNTMSLIIEELKSQGISSATVSDGKVFFFSRAVIEELHGRLQASPELTEINLMIYSDPKKMAEARRKGKN
jgi:hypothetical protein